MLKLTRTLTLVTAAVATASVAFATDKAAEQLAAAAFKNPSTAFQSRLILSEWKGDESRAEEVNLSYSPPGMYRIDFLGFDGNVKRTVLTDSAKNVSIQRNANDKSGSVANYPPQFADMIRPEAMEALLKKNYTFSITGSDTFIGRSVWLLEMKPQTEGKPLHQLKIDKETLVVLEHRRFLPNDKIGSLTRFSTFEPNKTFTAGTFSATGEGLQMAQKRDFETKLTNATPPPANMRDLPAGFTLSSYNVFEVDGTPANHFYYSDGALPLSVFETKLPVKFPQKASTSEKADFMLVPTYGLSSVEQVAYGKRRGNYITIIGEVSPSLLKTIVHRFD